MFNNYQKKSLSMKQTGKLWMAFAMCAVVAACSHDDVFDPEAQKNPEEQKVANTFDFSTSQQVNLNVDYSAFETHGAVFFSVYDENPLNITTSEDGIVTRELKEGVSPIYANYTNNDGKFSGNIQLPSYAQHLYIVTGDFFVRQGVMEADVANGSATVIAENTAASRFVTRAPGQGQSTNDLDNTLKHLWYTVNTSTGSTIEAKYNKWLTPLGNWNSYSGYPEYIMTAAQKATKPNLVFTESELNGLYDAVKKVLNVNRTCDDKYITEADLQLVKDSEVSITLLGGNTCWNSSLGYYYYTGEAPSKQDLKIIMLFPNTQNGKWTEGGNGTNFNGNVGINNGDVVQLKYYPNIASGDLSQSSDIFPKGTKIGFILRSNGWGMQADQGNGPDKKHFYVTKPNTSYNRKYNVWGASTNGLSYCGHNQNSGDFKYVNPNGDSRTAKFEYEKADGGRYAIVSFEDACNDLNFSDVVFSLKPMDAFQELPKPEENVTTTKGVYCFEDLWPSKGDYDLNDAVVEFKHNKYLYKEWNWTAPKVMKESFNLTTYQNFVMLKSGLALTLTTIVQPTSIVMKKNGSAEGVNFVKDGDVYLLTEDIKAELGTEYTLELQYANGIEESKTATVKPFIYRNEENDQRWEVHIVMEAPTPKMNTNWFGKDDDCSDPNHDIYFVRKSIKENEVEDIVEYPFAFFLDNADIKDFKETILVRDNESKVIDEFFPLFRPWSKSKGVNNPDWYKHPKKD